MHSPTSQSRNNILFGIPAATLEMEYGLHWVFSRLLVLVVCHIIVIPASVFPAETIRIASWNLNNLHHELGVPLRNHAPARSADDYSLLRKYAKRLGADIVALQEVNGPKAAALVFPDAQYELYLSGRYVEDLETKRDSDRIYTGFAVRRGVFDAASKIDVPSLSVQHADNRPTRWGTEIVVEKDGKLLAFLSVHLKSGCFAGNLETPTSDNCQTLAKQREPLEAWIDEHTKNNVPFVILGDFNRRFDMYGQADHLWEAIDDGDPPGLKLWRLPFRMESNCWRGTSNYYQEPIDFFIFSDRAKQLVNEASFAQLAYESQDQNIQKKTPSDHCPIIVELSL